MTRFHGAGPFGNASRAASRVGYVDFISWDNPTMVRMRSGAEPGAATSRTSGARRSAWRRTSARTPIVSSPVLSAAVAAESLDFERAAQLRDVLSHLERMEEPTVVMEVEGGDRDVIGYARDGDDAVVALMRIRAGKLQSVCRTLLMDATLFVEEPVGRHVRINIDAARRIKMHMVPSRGVHRWLANGLNWPRRANACLGTGGRDCGWRR